MYRFVSKYLFSILFLVFILSIFSNNIFNSLLLTTDLGRDLYNFLRITQGDFVLIGPKMNFGGYYAGPFYYYLFSPIMLLTNSSVQAVLYFQTFLFALSTAFFLYVVSQKYNHIKALLITLSISLVPFFLLSAKHPSNGYTYFPFLLFFSTLVFFFEFKNKLSITLLGFLAGFIVNIHPASIFPTVFISLYFLFFLKSKRLFLYFILGGLVTFLPLLLFELRHDFVMTKDTFVNNSLNSYINSSQKPQLLLDENPALSILFYLFDKFRQYLHINIIGFILFPFLIIIYQLKNKSVAAKDMSKDIYLLVTIILNLLLLFPLMLFHYENHYLYGIMFYIAIASLLIILKSKFSYLLIIFVLVDLYFFPLNLYKDSDGLINKIEASVKYVVENNLVTKGQPFNLIRIADVYAKVPTGFEYRFFFRKYGYIPESEYDYKNANTLLIFSETPFYDIDQFKMWATEEFGREYFVNKEQFNMSGITIYKITKK